MKDSTKGNFMINIYKAAKDATASIDESADKNTDGDSILFLQKMKEMINGEAHREMRQYQYISLRASEN